jgi:diaminohydroxyphosphoribosylaminopyrimidine deaminase/5-amino-6-(5-phosphoribosylamino)uracil reductase
MHTFTAQDHAHMARALALAAEALAPHPNPRVGCVIVRDGAVVGEGFHAMAGEAHAEVAALAAAGAKARGATAFVTLEPCCHQGRTPPCTEALVAAGVAEVVGAMVDPNPKVAGQGFAALERAGIAVRHGLMNAPAAALNPGFVKRMKHGRPFVRVKLGMSLDARIALAGGESRWITGSDARDDVQRLRARSDAIVTGIDTVLADDPNLTVRDADGGTPPRQPLRVVLDSTLQLPADARLLAQPGRTLVFTAARDPHHASELSEAHAEVRSLPTAVGGGLDLEALLDELGRREINEVLVEAGPTLAGAFVAARLCDELVLYVAPTLLGDTARPAFALPALASLDERTVLEVLDLRAVGADWRVTARLAETVR